MIKAKQIELSRILREGPHFLPQEDLEFLASQTEEGSLDFLELAVERGFLQWECAAKLWSDLIGVAHVDPFGTIVSRQALNFVPPDLARKLPVLPLYTFGDTLTVAMPDPSDSILKDRLEKITQCPISPVFSFPTQLRAAVDIHYQTEKGLRENLADLEALNYTFHGDMSAEELADLAQGEALIKVADSIVLYALRERASDLHFEPMETNTVLRFRIDGILRKVLNYPRRLHSAVISRFKIVSHLNIAETRFPQDGRFTMKLGSSKVDFRLSFMPTVFGEKLVVRVLAVDDKTKSLQLDDMMISQTILKPYKRLIQNPNGILFVTGPTGSGKSTTLYSSLREINEEGINIISIEDPVEQTVPGINQSQVNSNIDLTFSLLLRSILRQDPDVILIGEIRDRETAKIAVEAALTGHLVLSTLHTNNALQAIVRLIEIGVEPYQVAPSIIGVVAQRLAARICEHCKEPYYPTRETMLKYFVEEGLTEVPFYRGRGCAECNHTGYHGRIAFHELVLITEEMRDLITHNAGAQELAQAARKVGYRPLRYDGLKKVLLGLTTIDQIEENTSFEWAY